jgi:hypothetical protein
LERDFPLECDWMLQDLAACGYRCSLERTDRYPIRWFGPRADADLEKTLLVRVIEELGVEGETARSELENLSQDGTPSHARRWLELYAAACHTRREDRLRTLSAKCPAFVFTKHFNMGGSHYAFTEGLSDAQSERHFVAGSALCLLEITDGVPVVRTLLSDSNGVIRDPDVSYEGDRVLFAWKKSDRLDDYHLHELDLASGKVRQLTFGLGFADYEGVYLPGGDLLFNSTRCVQAVDCFFTEVSNLYTCDRDGRFLRRLGFDQVHSNYPTVAEDGRVLYTRWEYNDRGQVFTQGLFQMNPDGTSQTECYGNNSYFPTAILHARQIPGTQKVLAIASGHHCPQTGKLIVLDRSRGRQENEGAQLVAPVRATPADGNAWWQVEFGRVVKIDKVVIVLRADFPHDSNWHQAALVFSDGHRQTIDLEKKAEPQTFTFEVRRTSSLRLADLVQDEPQGWCALAEVEAWGRDLIAVAEDLSTPAP